MDPYAHRPVWYACTHTYVQAGLAEIHHFFAELGSFHSEPPSRKPPAGLPQVTSRPAI